MIRVAVADLADLADLADRFASIDTSRIDVIVRRLVSKWFARARVKTLVGIIAERHARAELQRIRTQAP